MPEPKPIDVHCKHCQQVIVPADRMFLLWNYKRDQRHADDLLVPHVQTLVILNADFICPNCGGMVYFRTSEQVLSRILRSISHE